MNLLIGLIALSVLVFVHELGHFLFAKLFGVGVLEFAIGFGKQLVKFKRGETTYSLRAIPLGGFVKMVGDDPIAYQNGEPQYDEETAKTLTEEQKKFYEDESKWFLKKKYYQKLLIVFAGPLFNIVFALFLSFFALSFYGDSVPVEEPIIGGVMPGQPAEVAGIKEKDFVRKVNNVEMLTWEQLAKTIADSNGEEMTLSIERTVKETGAVEKIEIKVVGSKATTELDVLYGDTERPRYKIGIVPDTKQVPISMSDAAINSALITVGITEKTVFGFVAMVSGLISPKHIGGPISIFKEGAKSAERGFLGVLQFMIFLSISLGVLNLLPIPILDGGHIVFFTIEKLLGTSLGIKFYKVANSIGAAMLLSLMIFAFGNDIFKLFK